MMTKKEAISLMENGKHEEAYNAFNELYINNKKDYESLYFRALIDFIHLKKDFNQTFEDFELLATVKHNYLVNTLHILTAIYDEFNEYDKVLEFAPKAIEEINRTNTDQKFLLLPYFALARAYYHSDSKEDLEIGLMYVDKGLKITNDEPDVDYYWLKTDILILLKRFDEAKKVISEMINKIPNEPIIYFSRARLASEQGYDLISNDKKEEGFKYLEDALDYLNIYENYTTNEFVQDMRVDILIELGKPDDAIKLIDDSIDDENKEDKIHKKVSILNRLDRSEEAINVCYDYLKQNNSLRIKFILSNLIFNREDATAKELETAKELLEEVYKEKPNESILVSLIVLYNKLGLIKEAYDEIFKFYNGEITNGKLAYFMADFAKKLNLDYKIQEKYYLIAFQKGYIDKLEYLTDIYNVTSYPKEVDKALSKMMNIPMNDVHPWIAYDLGMYYLYGNTKIKQNLDKAYLWIKYALDSEPEISCFMTALGRVFELKKDYKQMFKYYQKAHEMNLKNDHISCVCTFGYLAHAYINGLGVEKNVETAKKLILEAIKIKGLNSGNNVSYLYAYFALNNEEGFDLEYAFQLMKKQMGFSRYEISRYIILRQLSTRLNRNVHAWDSSIKECLKIASRSEKQYYKENISKEVSYPHFKHF